MIRVYIVQLKNDFERNSSHNFGIYYLNFLNNLKPYDTQLIQFFNLKLKSMGIMIKKYPCRFNSIRKNVPFHRIYACINSLDKNKLTNLITLKM